MSRPPLGTLAWVRATGGVMSRPERARSIAQGVLATLRTLPARYRHRHGLGSPEGLTADLDRIQAPDSAVAGEAAALCRAASDPFLVNHCERSYLWGMLLARAHGRRPDPEVLYVAALLHDLGLTEAHAHDHAGIACFAGQGGETARAWAIERGWPEERAEAVGDAIALHLNVRVAASHGPEAELLNQATALDVVGVRHWLISSATADSVVARHPRASFKRAFPNVLCAVAEPGTRADLLHNRLRFPMLIARSPFAD